MVYVYARSRTFVAGMAYTGYNGTKLSGLSMEIGRGDG